VQRKSIDVGEVIAEVADEPGAWFGLPVLCLAKVSRGGIAGGGPVIAI
jgi:hypothetical protein